MEILVIQNHITDTPGLIGDTLRALGARLTIINHLEDHDPLPPDSTGKYSGLLVLGGTMGAFDDQQHPQIPDIIHLIRDFHNSELPVLGICLGAQMLARALGCRYKSNGSWEIGMVCQYLTAAGKADPVLQGLPETLKLCEWHQDSFFVPTGAELLIKGNQCVNQAFRAGKASYGFQSHPEVTPQMIEAFINEISKADWEKLDPEVGNQIQTLRKEMVDTFPQSAQYARQIATNWYQLLNAID